jgi:hypothetical protein
MVYSEARIVRTLVTALALGAILLSPGAAAAREHVRAELSPVSDPDARGQLRLTIRQASDGRLELRVRKLDASALFEVLVNGVKVGALNTRKNGSGRVRFRSRPRGRDLTLGFDPHGAAIVVRNSAGEDVLQGTVPIATPGSDDVGKVICCVPDDSGSECEDRTPDQCAAQGGTVSTATSCLPNPCDGAPPPNRDLICCIPNDAGPECEDRSAEQCAAQGGIVVEASSCVGNPCAGTPPPADADTRCCLPDDSGPECEDRTPTECAAQGGTDIGPGVCTIDACGAASPSSTPAPTPGADDSGHHGGNSSSHNGGSNRGNDDPGVTATTPYYGGGGGGGGVADDRGGLRPGSRGRGADNRPGDVRRGLGFDDRPSDDHGPRRN